MFSIPKSELSTHWWATAKAVHEKVGYVPEGDYYFKSEQEAIAYAQSRKKIKLRQEYALLQKRVSSLAFKILRIRSLWNSQLRESVNKHLRNLETAKVMAAIEAPEIEINRLPNIIPVQGTRIPIGTVVYVFDSYSLRLRKETVIREHIYYYDSYPEGVPATYTLSDGSAMKSLMTGSYSNIEFYLDAEAASTRMREAVKARIQELQKRLT